VWPNGSAFAAYHAAYRFAGIHRLRLIVDKSGGADGATDERGWAPRLRHIDRAAVIEGRCDQSLGLSDAVVRGHDRSCTDHRLGHLVEQIELAVAQCVVNEAMRLLHFAGRHADQMKYR